MKRIYLDTAASTPVRAEVIRAMMPFFAQRFGNASSLHSYGQEGIAALDAARTEIAQLTHTSFRDCIFTGSATEANNLALRGTVKRFKETHKGVRPRIIVSSIEHESVLETAKDLERDGIEVVILPVDARGIVDMVRLTQSLNERTVLVSVMYVNNEIGTVEPIPEIASVLHEWRIAHEDSFYPLLHTDAVQAFNYYPCAMPALGVDLLTLSGHKIGGPKGVGCLCVRDREARNILAGITTGGGQEFGMRSGTENVAAIAGFAAAARAAAKERAKESARLRALKLYFWKEVKKIRPDARLHGMEEGRFNDASPHIVNAAFPNIPVDDILVRFDRAGIAVSSGSACAARSAQHSHVLTALFEGAARGIRFSFGRTTTRAELAEALRRIRLAFSRV